jgi:hypothetical protein
MTIAKSSYEVKRMPALKYLPAQYVKSIHLQLNGRFSKSYIRKVVQGISTNDEILNAAIELSQKREKFINNLLNKKNLQ